MPDWSGQWEIVGATPNASGGLEASLDQVLKEMQWSPPNKPETQSVVDALGGEFHKYYEEVKSGTYPGGELGLTCTFGFPMIMIDSPLMFEVLPTPKETVLIFSAREVRHVYTDGRPHTAKEDLWPTPWGDSIGHWEGQTLVIDTIAVKSVDRYFPADKIPIIAMGGDLAEIVLVTVLSPQAHFIERIRMIDKDHLENQMTIVDPDNFIGPWHLTRTYERVQHVNRMVYEDCEGEDRNPIVNGKFTLAPPPSSPMSQPAPASKNTSSSEPKARQQ